MLMLRRLTPILLILLCVRVALATPESFVIEITQNAEAGDAKSQRLLGYMYWLGVDVKEDSNVALKWMQMAAEQGDVTAQKAMADFYFVGTVVARDLEASFAWLERAAQQGDAEAQTSLAACYYAGRGTEQDIPKAVEWLNKAVAQNHEEALMTMTNLKNALAGRGYDHLFRDGAVPELTAESITLYDRALAYYKGVGVEKNPLKAFELAGQSAMQGYVEAYVLVGEMYLDGQAPTRNYKKALEWFTKAAYRNHAQAQYYLSIMYYEGKGTTVDFIQAYKWALIAAANAPDSDLPQHQMLVIRNRMTPSAVSRAELLARQWMR